MTAEERRLQEARQRTAYWKRWGPYVTEREWGTVRGDYSPHGTAWEFFPHDHARSRAYRWGEDGLAGISDNHQRLCFALALWNGCDPIVKERLFGLAGPEGNHGEDVKEYYFYLDSTPTHSYMKHLYKYPHRITATNRGPEAALLHVLPTLWFRNTWSWCAGSARPALRALGGASAVIEAEHDSLGMRWLVCEGSPELLFTENESNAERLWGLPGPSAFVKDGINDHVVHGAPGRVNPARTGTKAAAHYRVTIGPGEAWAIKLRLSNVPPVGDPLGPVFEGLFAQRIREADEFYATVIPRRFPDDARSVMRQALAGLLWGKQFYHYDLKRWLEGDPAGPPPPPERRRGRNHEWTHLYNEDVISMPDKWEYPWYAAWDLAFHCLPLALVDPDFAKEQLILFLREWYMHPNGQLPAYEWALGDVNPPVHAWAAWRVYKIEKRIRGTADRAFLERVFHKLLLNFTWWVNRKDAEGRNIFQGGFLGLDNIGVFDRSAPLPTGGYIEQSDGTSWMAMYCLNMLAMALELARANPAYEDVASKFFEHFVYIAHAMHDRGGAGVALWDDEDGFFYDVLHLPDGRLHPLKVRSLVGLIPLFAVETLEPDIVSRLPGFARRMQWFIDNRPEFREHVELMEAPGKGTRRLLSLVTRQQLPRVLRFMLDEAEFLSPHGIRSLSRVHRERPYVLDVDGREYRVDYEPAESSSGVFGGNSNWRGPVWFPVNHLLIESLQKFDHFYGDSLKVACPAGSERLMTLWETSLELSRRLAGIFVRDESGRRPVFGRADRFQSGPHWRDFILFHEYFDGDTGAGLGASHQTGWTGLVAKLMQQYGARGEGA
ncbi:MAG: glucosidase [Candidatus Rokuibacteriota bacterium]|nr:MAG: glucosidase [Candidatus Rokubacteria bacterium]